MEEVVKMIEAGEIDVAVDELRWLLDGCTDFIDAHRTLGELALLDNDYALARGHFGYGFRLGEQALQAVRPPDQAPYRLTANQAFFEAGKGLVFSLIKLGKPGLAASVVAKLVALDPSDPLQVRAVLEAK